MGTGSGEGGGGTGGGGAGNPDGRPGADGGLSATGNKDVNRHGNSQDGTDLHNDNTGVKGGRSETGEAKENPDKTKEMPQPTESKATEEVDAKEAGTTQNSGAGTGDGNGSGEGEGGETALSYQELRESFRQLIAGASSRRYANEYGIDQAKYRHMVESIYSRYLAGELDEVQSKAFEDAMKDAAKSGIKFGSYNEGNTMSVSY
jgi:hypothetical protein